MRILITGGGGFVGPHLIREFAASFGAAATIIATSHDGSGLPPIGQAMPLDITDHEAVNRVLRETAPTHVVHLAAVSSLSDVSADWREAWRINTLGTLALAEAVLRWTPHAWLIFAGTGLVYGETARSSRQLDEAALLAPSSDYAVTKAAADLALGALAARGLKSVRLRLFNHTGPGQSEPFVVPAFAAQIARIEAGRQAPVIRVGNLGAARDFLDVRDVAAAYALAIARADELSPGLILNIASGESRTIRSVLDELLGLSQVPIAREVDPVRLRPSDTPLYVGDAALARRLLGWQPRHPFGDTLAVVLAYWRTTVASE